MGFWNKVALGWNQLFEHGIQYVLDRGSSYLINSLRIKYQNLIGKIRKYTKSEIKIIDLNGVKVGVEINILDNYIPLYHPPYPTTDIPNYEHAEVESIRQYVDVGDNVVVLGGGRGVTSVVACKESNSQVTTYEQDSSRFDILKRTINLNQCEGTISPIFASVRPASGEDHRGMNVNIVKPEELPKANVYEIDVEGSETQILPRMEVRPNYILIETHSNHEEVASILRNMNYEIIDVVDDGVLQHPDCTHIRARYTL